MTIYDMMGRLIKILLNGSQTARHKNIKWNATDDKMSQFQQYYNCIK